MQASEDICACCMDTKKRRHRDFSPQIWALLLQWEEVPSEAVDQPMCNSCYDDVRGVLIERADEVELTLAQTSEPQLYSDAKREAGLAGEARKAKKTEKVAKIAS